ncbi:hypothetical protein PIROE2DRAFT_20051 [Piromyces sp. E2]|nr:hypothetical protein PIROE2DRAFT_20051 [Piromyces sp. E2]|eukprot:OUM67277.1 hypothetical protein PIROE2DRAFT_20051 [Piromyces sp. E2]
MDYYDEYNRDLIEYENELYKDPAEESEDEDEIDSEIEDKLLSAIHYSSDLIGSKQRKTDSFQNSKSELKSKSNYKNKPQKPSIINSANVIPALIYNEAKTKSISKTDLSNIYNLGSDDSDDNDDSSNDDSNNNIKMINNDSDDSEDDFKIGLSNSSSLNNKKISSNNDSISNGEKVDFFEDLTNQTLPDLNVVTTINTGESENEQNEITNNNSDEYITHIILPSNFDEEKSTNTSLTNTTENFEEDLDNKRGTTRYFAPQAKKEVICYFCRQAGHLSIDCDQKKTLCPICKDNHDPLKCPYSNACLKCACIGHQSRDCPNLWQRQECKFCYEYHNTVECPYLWRRYNLNVKAYKYKSNVRRYCYNCGLEGHFGDECEERRYNKVFKVSAHSINNEDPQPITNEEIEAWHFEKDKRKSFSLKNNHSHNNYKHNHSRSSSRSRNSSNDYNDNYNSDYSSKRNRNRKRSRNQDYNDSDNYSDYSSKKNDFHKSNKSNRSEHNNDKFNHNNSKSKNNRNNNYNGNNNYDSKYKKRKSNYNFNNITNT